MENYTYHIPAYVVTGGIATTGHSADLTPGRLGLFDRNTYSVATAIGNGKEFFFAQAPTGGLDWYGQPNTRTHKSPYFFGKDILNMYMSEPQRLRNEEWVLGYNGSASSVGLSYVKGEEVRVHFIFTGQPTYRFFGGPKEYVVSYTPKEDCLVPCNADDCPEGIVDCEVATKQLIQRINEHPELYKFGVTAKYVSNTFSATTPNMEKYCLDVCDNGDALALQAVQAQAPTGVQVVRIERSGSTSTYEFCQPEPDSAPSNFQQSAPIELAVCGVCPAGSTLTEAKDVWFVTRPLAGTDDLNDTTARQTYADAIGTAYEAAHADTFDSVTDVEVVAASDAITLTGHIFETGNKVTYSDGGGTALTGLTDLTDYYVIKVDADTIQLATTAANAYAGTAIAIADGVGAAHQIIPVITATFNALGSGHAVVKLKVGSGIDLTAQASDTIVFSNTEGTLCTFSAPSSIAWTACGSGIRASRTLRIKNINRPDCDSDGNRLTELTSILAGVVGIQIDTLAVEAGDACKDDYTVDQYSVDCLPEGCLTSNVTFTYDTLPSFENEAWEVVEEEPEEDDTRKCGIRVSAGYVDPRFGDCSFNPLDYYETEPVKFELSLLGETWSNCDYADRPTVSQSQIGQIARQSGEYVVRNLIMKSEAYLKHSLQFSMEPRMREAFDQNLLSTVDRTAFYNLYYVTFKASYGATTWRTNEQEEFTAVFAFKENDISQQTFQTQILDVLTAKSGVSMHVNEGNVGGTSGMQA